MDLRRINITLDWEEENMFMRHTKKGYMTISDHFSQRHIKVKLTMIPDEEQVQIDGVELFRLYPTQNGLDVDMAELRALVNKHIEDTLNTPKKD